VNWVALALALITALVLIVVIAQRLKRKTAVTNQHVYEFYKHYLTGPECGGIEFIAERDRDASDYVPFNGQAPLIIPNLDISPHQKRGRAISRDKHHSTKRINIPEL